MGSIIDKLSIVQKFLNTLTWKKIAQLMVFLFIVALAWAAYENRSSVYNFVGRSNISGLVPITQTLSNRTTAEIDALVEKSDLINGIQITIVDFQKNTRYIVYTSVDNKDLKNVYLRIPSSSGFDTPLFNADLMNNQLLVSLINGEFICHPYGITLEAKMSPETLKYINVVCANGIPPYYGRFSGIVSVYTRRSPTSEEVDQIRTLSKNLALTIYDRDFK